MLLCIMVLLLKVIVLLKTRCCLNEETVYGHINWRQSVIRDRNTEISMLQDTLQILKQGWYEKNGKRIQLKLSAKDMEEIQVYLPDDVKKSANCEDFNPPFVTGGRCGHGCENINSFALARKRLGDTYLFTKDDPGILVLNLANPVNPGGGV